MKYALYYWHKNKPPVLIEFVKTVEELNRGLKDECDNKTDAERECLDKTQAQDA